MVSVFFVFGVGGLLVIFLVSCSFVVFALIFGFKAFRQHKSSSFLS